MPLYPQSNDKKYDRTLLKPNLSTISSEKDTQLEIEQWLEKLRIAESDLLEREIRFKAEQEQYEQIRQIETRRQRAIQKHFEERQFQHEQRSLQAIQVAEEVQRKYDALIESTTAQAKGRYDDIRSLVEKAVVDPENKEALLKQVDQYKQASEEVTSASSSQQRERFQIELAKQRQDMDLERGQRQTERWIWMIHRILDRSLIATVIGGFLLFVITAAMIVAMWQGRVGSNILENAFLVLLGYFFGQLSAKSSLSEAPPKVEN